MFISPFGKQYYPFFLSDIHPDTKGNPYYDGVLLARPGSPVHRFALP